MIGVVVGSERKKNKDGKNAVLMLKVQITDPNDIQEVQAFPGFGVDTNPPNGTKVNLTKSGQAYKIGTSFNLEKLPGETGPGEYRIYSTDESGTLKAEIFLKSDGSIQINKGTDFAVAFNNLKSGFDQLKQDHNNFLLHVHGSSGTPPIPPAIPSTASIDASKVAEVNL